MAATGRPPIRGALVAHLRDCGTNSIELDMMNKMLCDEIAYAEEKLKSFTMGEASSYPAPLLPR